MAETASKVSMKLLIDRRNERVVFAEAGKDLVDFLFHLFSLPLGSLVSLLSKENMVGCLGKLYGSIETLNDTYILPSANKNMALNPKTPSYASNATILLPGDSVASTLYGCPNASSQSACLNYVSDDPQVICPQCKAKLDCEMDYVPAGSGGNAAAAKTDDDEKGYVKGLVTYMIMDDLQVRPMSSISSITLLKTFNVKDLGDLEEKEVYLSMPEGLKLLKASLQSKTALTDVFLGKKD